MALTKSTPRVIHLGGHGTSVNDLPGSGSITPGMLVERYSNAGVPTFRAHSTAGGNAVPTFALDQRQMNKGIDDVYASGDLVDALVCWPGAVVYAIIASGQNIAAGNFLESAGDGKLRILAAGKPIAQAMEDVNNSAGPGDARLRVETY